MTGWVQIAGLLAYLAGLLAYLAGLADLADPADLQLHPLKPELELDLEEVAVELNFEKVAVDPQHLLNRRWRY